MGNVWNRAKGFVAAKYRRLGRKGQMVVFLALMFQVLFVFFAMVVSVGMLVHQKINLQNAADLGAYYAASRQAEVLNAIGHSNYQIRQAWKLLAFRYRVLTQLGVRTHPWRTGQQGETPWSPNGDMNSYLSCVTYESHWQRTPPDETSCFRVNDTNYNVPALPIPQVQATFLQFNNRVRQLAQQLRQAAFDRCTTIGFVNWFYLAMVFSGYKQDVANRKAVILGLADNMARDGSDMRDIYGRSVLAGVEETIIRNLTDGFAPEEVAVNLYNSMSDPTCAARETWLPEIRIDPSMWYADFEGSITAGCSLKVRNLKGNDARPTFYNDMAPQYDPGSEILEFTRQEFDTLFHSSLGYEKNPWCMVYSGVTVQSSPSIPFLPLSRRIQLTARSYAKPFGGRVGPWYQSSWPSGAPRSSGGQKVDPLVPPRSEIGGGAANPNDPTRLPNYSRFPGDTLGLTSASTQFHFGSAINQLAQAGKMNYDWWIENLDQFNDQGSSGDSLAFDVNGGQAPPIRFVEIMAIRPDMFDATYYSVEPNYTDNYLAHIRNNTFNLQGANGTVRFRGDMASRGDDFVNIQGQLQSAQPNLEGPLTYFVSAANFGSLLTGWAEQSTVDYSMQTAQQNFAKCNQASRPEVPTPGQCQYGGRVGYSVKIVNPDMLVEPLPIGGGGATGQIMNPPPEL